MIRTPLWLLAATLSILSIPFPSTISSIHAQEEREFTKADLQDLYVSFLKREGYNPSIDDDGDVAFKSEGKNYFISIDEKDPQFFRLVFPAFWKIEDESERKAVSQAALHSSTVTKCAKVFVVKDNVWASIELFLAKPSDFEPIFSRSLSALRAGVKNFAEKMQQ